MTPTNPPNTQNRVLLFFLHLIQKVFGQVQWQAPEWIPWTGHQFRRGGHFLIADKKRLAIIALVFVTAVAALTWYKVRPRPHYVEYTVTAPDLTQFDDNGVPTIHPLTVDFEEPVAPLANLDKRLTSGIEISPAFAGKWTWSTTRNLQFTPSSDWPVDACFSVKIGRKGFLAKPSNSTSIALNSRPSHSPPKSAKNKFYQDPQNPALKNLVATVEHSATP